MQLDIESHRMTAIVLAGDRTRNDPLAQSAAAGSKALVEIGGEPMVYRVLRALRESRTVARTILAGPSADALDSAEQLKTWINAGELDWQPPSSSPSTSAWEVMRDVDSEQPVLLTTADHPLLTAEMVDAFGRQSLADDVDVTVGLAPYALVQEAYPNMRKTVLRFSDGEFCGCNLFAFLTPEGRSMADFWRRIEQQRKKPLRVIGMLGWRAVIRYRLGLLPLDEALGKLGKRLGLRLRAVILPYANASIDVDSIADLALVRDSLRDAAGRDASDTAQTDVRSG
jgi:CTP:molybdopterin cytidylyltransferase MocA